MTKTFKTVYLALLVAQSLALFLFEGLIPLPFLAPGAKLGLANLITLIALYTLPRWQDTLLGFVTTNIFEAMSTASKIPIIIFALLCGVVLNQYVACAGNRLLVDLFDQGQQVILGIIQIVVRIAPIGVFALLANLAGNEMWGGSGFPGTTPHPRQAAS